MQWMVATDAHKERDCSNGGKEQSRASLCVRRARLMACVRALWTGDSAWHTARLGAVTQRTLARRHTGGIGGRARPTKRALGRFACGRVATDVTNGWQRFADGFIQLKRLRTPHGFAVLLPPPLSIVARELELRTQFGAHFNRPGLRRLAIGWKFHKNVLEVVWNENHQRVGFRRLQRKHGMVDVLVCSKGTHNRRAHWVDNLLEYTVHGLKGWVPKHTTL